MRFVSIVTLSLLFLTTCGSQKKGENKQENSTETTLSADSLLVQKVQSHVNVLCTTSRPRNHENMEILDSVATYIFHQFEAYCDTVYYQTFEVNKKTYKNVIGVLNVNASELVVIGAHYDVCGETPGADDNASGVSGLIESGRLLSKKEIKNRIELVAFTLEEPPYFRTENMGSYHYAKKLKKEKADLKYMVCLEMIGYYDENKNTQEYPVDAMKHQYGTQANFLAVVENEKQGNVGKDLFDKLKSRSSIKYEYVQAPSFLTGVDFSDHLSFWKLGLKAFMITDTSFYRNKHYHEDSDKPELLDYNKIALFVVDFVNSF